MYRKLLSFFISFFVLQGISAQQLVSAGWKFHSSNQLGLLNGENHTAAHLQSVNGVQYKNLFVGAGVGLDYYEYRSIPVFAELRKYFGKSKNQVFVYADGGVNFVWAKKDDEYIIAARYRPQFYGAAGFGYQVPFKNGTGLVLSAGYSNKKVRYERDLYNSCPIINGPCALHTETYKYNFNRVLLQIGLIF